MTLPEKDPPEFEALRNSNAFPQPDAARDKRVRGSMNEAIQRQNRRSSKNRWITWGATAAALVLIVGGLSISRLVYVEKYITIDDAEISVSLSTTLPSPEGLSSISIGEDSESDAPKAIAFYKRQEVETAPDIATWRPSKLVPNTSRLLVGDKEELPLKTVQVNARVDGFRARVLIDLYFLNDRDRQLEGNFQLRLPGEASPYFFAFGESQFESAPVDGKLFTGFLPEEILAARAPSWTEVKEARMVPREKAAQAYRETVRRVVDPALLEWSGAGIFSARVFPLRPGKLERVVIGYDLDLARAGDSFEFRLDLPQGVSETAVDLSAAAVEGLGFEVSPASEPVKSDGRSTWRFKNPTDHLVTLRVKGLGPALLEGIDPKTGSYFAARLRPELPEVPGAAGSSRAVFLVDTSLSSNPEKFNIWLKLLRAILDRNRDSLKSFAVLFFNIESFWWKEEFIENTDSAVAELLAFASRLSLEGATDLGSALKEAARPSWLKGNELATAAKPWDLFFLSDGAATWGEGEPYALSSAVKSGGGGALFAYSSGLSGTDLSALAHLARETNGAVFSVAGEAEIEKAAIAHRSRPWQLAGVSIDGGTDLLIAGRPQSVFHGQELVLVGRGAPRAGSEVVLTLRQEGVEKSVRTRMAQVLPSDLAPRLYAQVAVGQLEDLQSAAEPIARSYATHFRVTGRTCSLLMLESEQEYQRYNIKPEEDALVVKMSAASEVVAKALKELGDALGDPKAAFLTWLKKMESMPGLELKIETALRLALESLPKQAFTIEPTPLRMKLRTNDGIPGKLQESLASQTLDYDLISAEAVRRLAEFGPADALKAASSLIEANPGDGVLARDVGFSALEWGLGGQAYHLFRRVADSRPNEPENYRAMALCLEELKDADLALAYYEIALAGKWDQRFGEFRKILGLEYLRFLRRIERGELSSSVREFARARLETAAREFDPGPTDLLVTISWNTDGTDVDLHVIEPGGEECFYQHPTTQAGGHLTQDVTQGYGPEMYAIRKAPAGKYRILAHYFAADRNRLSARTKVYATIVEGWGTPAEKITRKSVQLAEGKEVHEIIAIDVRR
jgi:tetratricopeptide (TPR) repeat protein